MRRWAFGVLVMAALLVASCSSNDESSGSTRALPTPRPAPTVAGRSIEASAPESTDLLAVVGVAAGQALPIYALPGSHNPLVGEIPNTAEDVHGLDEAFQTDDGAIWWFVRWETFQGWVEPMAAYLGSDLDVTLQVVGDADPAQLVALSIDDLALATAEQFLSTEPSSRVVLVSPADVADNLEGTAIVDVIGLGDDSLAGFRLLVSGDGSATQGAEFELRSVHQISLCTRGVTPDGLCR